MFKTVLWATDGSDNATRGLAIAAELAAREHGTLHVTHVIERYYGGRGSGLAERVDEPDVYARIDAQIKALDHDGFEIRTHWPHASSGATAHSVAEVADEVGADVIVIGTRGHGGVAGVLLGSVTQRLLHEAPCPVLAIPPVKHSRTGLPAPDAEPASSGSPALT